MPKRISSAQGWLQVALDLAREKKLEEALRVLDKLTGRSLQASDLRMAAQVNRRCERPDRAEACWKELERRGEMESGDYYMFGSLQAQLSKPELAAQCFEREIAVSTNTGNDYFLGSAGIRLADLLMRLGQPSRAKEILASLKDGSSDYVDGVGLRTKAALLDEIAGKTTTQS